MVIGGIHRQMDEWPRASDCFSKLGRSLAHHLFFLAASCVFAFWVYERQKGYGYWDSGDNLSTKDLRRGRIDWRYCQQNTKANRTKAAAKEPGISPMAHHICGVQ